MTTNNLLQASGFPRAVLSNGLGRYVCQLQRITIKFCKSHGSSRGVREFIEHDLVNYAKANPNVVVYVKPRRHRGPVFVAEYLNGERKWMSVENFSRDEVNLWLNHLKSVSGIPDVRLRKFWHTDNPSIQGPWSPFLFKNPQFNVAKFPDNKFSVPYNLTPSATEILLEMFKNREISKKEGEEEANVSSSETSSEKI